MAHPTGRQDNARCATLDDADLTHRGVESVIIEELRKLRPEFALPPTISVHPEYFPARKKPDDPCGRPREDLSRDFAHALFQQELSALCLSGGGIRSASFCLGVLQELAKKGLLADFDYISTVSGGGYIGSWLSAWRKHGEDAERERHRLIHETEECVKTAKTKAAVLECLENAENRAASSNRRDIARSIEAARERVRQSEEAAAGKDALFHLQAIKTAEMGGDAKASEDDGNAESIQDIELKLAGFADRQRRIREDAPEVEKLRSSTSYLTPRMGLMSLDSWASFATVVRNLALNWLLFLPAFLLLVAVPYGLSALFEYIASLRPSLAWEWGNWTSYLLPLAVLLYAASELFTSAQLVDVQRERREFAAKPLRRREIDAGRKQASRGFGASEKSVLWRRLPAVFVSAYLVWAVSRPALAGVSEWDVYIGFTAALALLWGLSFLLVWLFHAARERPVDPRWLWLVFARFVGGAGAGAGLALVFSLLRRFECQIGDPYVFILGVSGGLLAHFAGGVLFAGVTSIVWDRVDREAVREWMARAGGLFMAALAGWTIYAVLVLSPWSQWLEMASLGGWRSALEALLGATGGVAGAAAAFFGFSKASGRGKGAASSPFDSVDWTRVAVAAAIIFFSIIAIEASRVFDWAVDPSRAGFGKWMLVFGFLALWGFLASLAINVNVFSLHAYYRNRLIRAYLGASNAVRWPSRFTGFDDNDNLRVHELDARKPLHVLNLSLNLAGGRNLAWQERKASSFTITPLSVGNPHLGYRPPKEYGSEITLGTAMAISGAAVSSSMGYHSSPALAFLMTLFNLRLGWWLGNPAHDSTWKRPGPQAALWYLVSELFGWTNDETAYVLLSDGGHFDNLGLYEMLRRRCRTIVVVDAGEDADFEFADLGNALRKARIDFGVEIRFVASDAASPDECRRLGLNNRPKTGGCWPYCAIAQITYREQPEGDDCAGTLIYIKPAIHGDEPEDIWSYASAHTSFPHESTLDQFFSESQFESYRRLGRHIGGKVFDLHGRRQRRFKHAHDLERRAKEYVECASRR